MINYPTLNQALENTKEKRKSAFALFSYATILNEIKNSEFQQDLWRKYQKQYAYAQPVDFDELFEVMKQLIAKINK